MRGEERVSRGSGERETGRWKGARARQSRLLSASAHRTLVHPRSPIPLADADGPIPRIPPFLRPFVSCYRCSPPRSIGLTLPATLPRSMHFISDCLVSFRLDSSCGDRSGCLFLFSVFSCVPHFLYFLEMVIEIFKRTWILSFSISFFLICTLHYSSN